MLCEIELAAYPTSARRRRSGGTVGGWARGSERDRSWLQFPVLMSFTRISPAAMGRNPVGK